MNLLIGHYGIICCCRFIAAVIVNVGAARAAQAVASTVLYYNDMLEYETGLPGVDYGRTEGVGVGFSFFSHSIYGGGGPGTFHGNHVVTRHAKGTAIPCASAAMCLDAGTQMFSVKRTSALIGTVYGTIEAHQETSPGIVGNYGYFSSISNLGISSIKFVVGVNLIKLT